MIVEDDAAFKHDLRAAVRTIRLFCDSILSLSGDTLTEEKRERVESSLKFLDEISQLNIQIKKDRE